MLPSVETVVEINLGGKPRNLFFSFRAWKMLGVNPMQPTEVQEFVTGLSGSIDKVAEWIVAGLAGYQALARRLAEQDGEPAPAVCSEVWDVDRVLDLLDGPTFQKILTDLNAASAGEAPVAEEGQGNV